MILEKNQDLVSGGQKSDHINNEKEDYFPFARISKQEAFLTVITSTHELHRIMWWSGAREKWDRLWISGQGGLSCPGDIWAEAWMAKRKQPWGSWQKSVPGRESKWKSCGVFMNLACLRNRKKSCKFPRKWELGEVAGQMARTAEASAEFGFYPRWNTKPFEFFFGAGGWLDLIYVFKRSLWWLCHL